MISFSRVLTLCLFLSSIHIANAQPPKKKQDIRLGKIKPKKNPIEEVKDTTPVVKKTDFEKFIEKSELKEGVLDILIKDNAYYLVIPDSMLQTKFLFGTRIVKTSNSKVSNAAGLLTKRPITVYFNRIGKKVFLHHKTSFDISEDDMALKANLERNTYDPIMYGFPVQKYNKDSTAVIININSFFLGSSVKQLSPFMESKGFIKGPSGIFKADRSSILEAKSFEKNVTIKSLMSYEVSGKPFSVVLNRTLLLLPELSRFKPRIYDPRVGYFTTSKNIYKSFSDGLKKEEYINKWAIYPKKEDIEAYKAGTLVVPEKPIVYHLDTNFPTFMKKHIREGILFWNKAFEKIGFKDAVQVKDYPQNDSLFDPENLQYTCIRYVANNVANAYGPSWTDPRTGEILQADIVFYHNLTTIIHAWMFAQTAAVNPAVRKKLLAEEEYGKVIRYVAAHEAGHTLGLPHNMAASHAIPVDSLRSATFTQQYGTTASIMDYARFNYVAQVGDEGVRLTPPDLGIYDEYAIAWGYTPLLDIEEPKDEYSTLNEWITKHTGDPMYRFGRQQSSSNVLDPSSQTEDLSNDVLKASKYGIKNIDYILDHLLAWKKEENKSYEEITSSYQELLGQYNLYIKHLINYLGGIYYKDIIQAENEENTKAYSFVDKEYQRSIVSFLFEEMKRQKDMWEREEIIQKFGKPFSFMDDYNTYILDNLLSASTLAKIYTAESNDAKTYSLNDLFEDVNKNIWAKTKAKQSLTDAERNMQYQYIKSLLKNGGYVSSSIFSLFGINNSGTGLHLNCNHATHEREMGEEEIIKSGMREHLYNSKVKLKAFSELKKAQVLLKKAQYTGDETTKYHYQYLLNEIENKMKKQ